MAITWNEIRDQVERSFVRYAKAYGYEPEGLARLMISEKKAKMEQAQRTTKKALGSALDFTIEFENPSMQSLFEADRKAAVSYTEDSIRDIVAISRKYSDLFSIDWSSFGRDVNEKGIDTESNEGLCNYLRTIPVVGFYGPDIEAYARSLPSKGFYIMLSPTLIQLLETFLTSIVINVLFPYSALGQNDTFPYIMGPIEEPPFNFDVASDGIIVLGKKYLSSSRFVEGLNPDLIRVAPTFYTLGMSLYVGMRDFIILHEFSHVLLGHFLGERSVRNEVSADNLAISTLLYSETEVNKLLAGALRPLFIFRAVGPIVLFEFLGVLNILADVEDSHTHPHPFVRKKYITTLVTQTLRDDEDLLLDCARVVYNIDGLFRLVHRKLNASADYSNSLDMSFLDKFPFTVVPTKSSPINFSVRVAPSPKI